MCMGGFVVKTVCNGDVPGWTGGFAMMLAGVIVGAPARAGGFVVKDSCRGDVAVACRDDVSATRIFG